VGPEEIRKMELEMVENIGRLLLRLKKNSRKRFFRSIFI
jgi:hypothetical protein